VQKTRRVHPRSVHPLGRPALALSLAVYLAPGCTPTETSSDHLHREAKALRPVEPDIVQKTDGFTKAEQDIIDRARTLVQERRIDVSGLQESLSRYERLWYVCYDPPGHTGIGGGGWEITFTYPDGELLHISRSQ